MQLFAEKGDFSNKKRPKRDPKSCLGFLRDPGLPKRDPVGSSASVLAIVCLLFSASHCQPVGLFLPVSTSHSAHVMSPLLVTIWASSRNRQQDRYLGARYKSVEVTNTAKTWWQIQFRNNDKYRLEYMTNIVTSCGVAGRFDCDTHPVCPGSSLVTLTFPSLVFKL